MKETIVIGGGASGLISAILIAKNGVKVTILERLDRVGKKLLTTGNGQGNISNLDQSIEHYHSNNIKTATDVLQQFNLDDTLNFFKSIGLETSAIKNRLYPSSYQASTILDLMRFEAEKLGINIITNTKVLELKSFDNKIVVLTDNEKYITSTCVVSCGGSSAPHCGTDGSSYKLLEKLGHKLILPIPSLVQLKTQTEYIKNLKGIRWDVKLSIVADEAFNFDIDEILFTDYGISGPIVFNASSLASQYLAKGKTVFASINFFPNLTTVELKDSLVKRFTAFKHLSTQDALIGIVNKQIAVAVLRYSKIDINTKTSELSIDNISAIINSFTNFRLEILDNMGFKFAQTTRGGLSLEDFDANLMSTKCKGLFASGEILDVDGDCGGYNLQWAWSSGATVAKGVIDYLKIN